MSCSSWSFSAFTVDSLGGFSLASICSVERKRKTGYVLNISKNALIASIKGRGLLKKSITLPRSAVAVEYEDKANPMKRGGIWMMLLALIYFSS